ncbi:transcriptional regulator [Chlorobaculum sp. 24CR]|uniref:transcriptional regulator n=1 Tax=Chlorobaculum sp. 24CR TaxID=2508878 RepID=UPI00100A4169|nr:transcriptional regulator [Chlorobaculum sp. 24CR]RXK84550.1 transcriptional regulator [Chlorobaculum sp. 24CR]
MQTCPISHLPVTSKHNWKSIPTGADYVKRLDLIGDNIFHHYVESDHPVTLTNMSIDLVHKVLEESGITDSPLYLLWDMNNIINISYQYKQGVNDIVYRSGLDFKVVVFYNIDDSCRVIIETFAAMAPNTMTVLLRDDYADAMTTLLKYRSGKTEELPEDEEADEEISMKNEFLATIARISWLNMLNQQIFLPPAEDPFYPYFKAIDHMQEDLRAKDEIHEKEMQHLKAENEQKLSQKIIQLNAQVELGKKEIQRFEQEKTALKSRIAAQEMELTRISTAVGEKASSLHMICDQIKSLDIESVAKQKILEMCHSMIETELTEKRLKTELTMGDSEFLSKLQKKHPNLNQRELRVSLMVKLNYDTREIARSIGISTRGMESIRYRMHRKLNLDKHKSIKTYLSELASEVF